MSVISGVNNLLFACDEQATKDCSLLVLYVGFPLSLVRERGHKGRGHLRVLQNKGNNGLYVCQHFCPQ